MFPFAIILASALAAGNTSAVTPRERICIDDNWRFTKGDPTNCTVSLLYDVREQKTVRRLAESEADGNANFQTTTNEAGSPSKAVIKQWILPSGNDFIRDASRRFVRPEENLGDGVAYVQPDFDDSSW